MTFSKCLENCPLIRSDCEGLKSFQACASIEGLLFACDAGGKTASVLCQKEAAAMGECPVGKPLNPVNPGEAAGANP